MEIDNSFRRSMLKQILFTTGLLWVLLPRPVAAQQVATPPQQSATVLTEDMYRAKGKLLTEGYNQVPTGPLKVKTYKLEEVALPYPREIGRGKRRQKVETALRLTITGEAFLPGTYKIWVDGLELPGVDYHPHHLAVLICDRSVLDRGSPLAITYESQGDAEETRTTLAERLELPTQVSNEIAVMSKGEFSVSLRHVRAAPQLSNRPGIQIIIRSDEPFNIGNSSPVLQIGRQKFFLSEFAPRDLHTLIFTLTLEEFLKLEDGQKICLTHAPSSYRGHAVGILSKSVLEK